MENNPLTNVDPTGHWCEATVNGLYYAHSGGCNDGKGGTRTSGDGYTIDGIHNGEWEWDKGKATKQYFNPGAPHISDPTGLSQALIGCATDAYCVPGIGGMVSKTAKVATVVSTEVVKVEKTMVNFVLKLDLQLFAKSDLKQVNAAAKQVGVDRIEFGEYIHELKKSLGRKANQNFTWEELIKYAKDLKK